MNAVRKEFQQVKKEYYQGNLKICKKCGSGGNVHLHHITPVIYGGTNDYENLSPLCSKCHKDYHNYFEDKRLDWDEQYAQFLSSPTVQESLAFTDSFNKTFFGVDMNDVDIVEFHKTFNKVTEAVREMKRAIALEELEENN